MGGTASNTADIQQPVLTPTAVPEESKPDENTSVVKEVPAPHAGDPSRPTKRRRKDKRRDKDRKKRDNRKSRYDEDYVEKDELNNANFAEYYKVQEAVPPSEHELFLTTLAKPLPSSFRVVDRGEYGKQILRMLHGPMRDLFLNVPDAKAPEPISWINDERAWVVFAPRQMLRRQNRLSTCHRFLVTATELGAVARQESVSMIPPLLLEPIPGESVLDMCAAPGSKTGQIIEALTTQTDENKFNLALSGLIVANDSDMKRCFLLAHQLKKFNSSQVIITNHDAQFFPKIQFFDRVLCDVPCSGDGTLRKAPDIWRRWNTGMGLGLHRLQRSILFRGIELVKPGGRLVYSTCSLNPIENEAIVASALQKFGPDVIELIDVSDKLPNLKRRPGMTHWKVVNRTSNDVPPNKDDRKAGMKEEISESTKNESNGSEAVEKGPLLEWYSDFSEVKARKKRKIVPSMFPPSQEFLGSGNCPLERCMRLVPHDQDTGGFFVAVFQKKIAAPIEKSMKEKADVEFNKEDKHGGNDMEIDTQQVKNGDVEGEKTLDNMAMKESVPLKKPESPIDVDMKADGETTVENKDAKKESAIDTIMNTDESSSVNKVENEGGPGSLEKGKLVTNEKEIEIKDPNANDERRGGASRLITDDPLIGVENVNVEALDQIAEFFGLNPEDCRQCFMTRGKDGSKFKKIVLVSPSVRELLRISVGGSESAILPSHVKRDRLRVVHAGVTLFERTTRKDSSCQFRVVSDGSKTLANCINKRVVTIGEEDLAKLVEITTVQIAALKNRDARRAFDAMSSGSALVRDKLGGEVACIWKARHAISLLIGKMERGSLEKRAKFKQKQRDGVASTPGENGMDNKSGNVGEDGGAVGTTQYLCA